MNFEFLIIRKDENFTHYGLLGCDFRVSVNNMVIKHAVDNEVENILLSELFRHSSVTIKQRPNK